MKGSNHEIEITSSCSPAEYAAALEQLLSREAAYPAPGEPPKKGIIRGSITGNKVTLYSSTRSNDFAPMVSGQILSSGRGMILRGKYHLPPSRAIFLKISRVFIIFLFTAFLAAMVYGAYTSRTFDFKIILALLFPTIVCGLMLLLAGHFAQIRPGKLGQFIQRSFDGVNPTAPGPAQDHSHRP